MSSQQALEKLMKGADREKDRDRTEAQRMLALNEAFLKPRKIIDEFRATMAKVRAQHRTASEQLLTSLRDRFELEAQQQKLGRNPDKELQRAIEGIDLEVQANRELRDGHAAYMERADKQRIDDLKTAYAEIEALGGRLTLTKPPPPPAVATEDES